MCVICAIFLATPKYSFNIVFFASNKSFLTPTVVFNVIFIYSVALESVFFIVSLKVTEIYDTPICIEKDADLCAFNTPQKRKLTIDITLTIEM